MVNDDRFGVNKQEKLAALERIYRRLGKPFNADEVGRANSRRELVQLLREARKESLRRGINPLDNKSLRCCIECGDVVFSSLKVHKEAQHW